MFNERQLRTGLEITTMNATAFEKCFYKNGVVVVTVHTANGKSHLEDWPPEASDEAREYAVQTSSCSDVKSVDYYNAKTGQTETFYSALP